MYRMPLTAIDVRVTKKNIKAATANANLSPSTPNKRIVDPTCCPIALALYERGYNAHVTPKVAAVWKQSDGELNNVYELPEIARKFIEAFDAGQPVEPISFTLERNIDEEE